MDGISSISPISLGSTLSAERVTSTSAAAKTFGQFMTDAAKETVDTIRSGETAMINGLSGKGSMQDAVSAILAAESSLQATMAIRDKAITAYNDILRMPI